MALILRIAGWIIFTIGAIIFIASGGFNSPHRTMTYVGLFTILAGIALTIISGLLAWYQKTFPKKY